MHLDKIKLDGNDFYFRDGTSDSLILSLALDPAKFEYEFPLWANPKCILDVGANIGVTALYLAKKFPNAIIHAFEPEPDNFEILRMNTEKSPNIIIHKLALGSKNQMIELFESTDKTNFGGHSTLIKSERSKSVQMVDASKYLWKENILPDFIKIDAEGAEYDILTTIPLEGIRWIEGELHKQKDWLLMSHLEDNGFNVGVTMPLGSMVGMFKARKNDVRV